MEIYFVFVLNEVMVDLFIHSENLYSTSSRNPLRSSPSPAMTKEKRLE